MMKLNAASTSSLVILLLLSVGSAIAQDKAIHVASSGNVGFGTDSPDNNLDIEAPGPGFRLSNSGPFGGIWDFTVNPNTGRLTWSDDLTRARIPMKFGAGAVNNLMRVGISNVARVDVGGDLAVEGNITATGTITPDYVFQPGYALPSIEEHAGFMWEHSRLPKVEAAVQTEDGKGLINLGQRSQALLEELEIAHIYIEKLNQRIDELYQHNTSLQQRLTTLDQNQQIMMEIITKLSGVGLSHSHMENAITQ